MLSRKKPREVFSLLIDFFTQNFMTLMILGTLTVVILVNRKIGIQAAGYFAGGMVLSLLITFVNYMNGWIEQARLFTDYIDLQYTVHLTMAVCGYILRPLIIMILAFLVIPNPRFRLPCTIPAIINAIVYIWVSLGDDAHYLIEKNSHWQSSITAFSVIYTECFYLFLLLLYSLIYFKQDALKRAAILFLIAVQSVLASIIDAVGISNGITIPITAACLLEYYFYLSVIYQHELHEQLVEREMALTEQKLSVLRSQIHPHFILNSLAIIRSLVKRDTPKAMECLDYFADYLHVHIFAIQSEQLIDFEQELRHVKAYLSLVQADTARKIDVQYDLNVTGFQLPPLSLEPVIENAVKYGTGKDNGIILITTHEIADRYIISVADNGTGSTEQGERPVSTGVGITNTQKRLAVLCGGSLIMEPAGEGMHVTIMIPKKQEIIA